MIELHIICAQCGKEFPDQIVVDDINEYEREGVMRELKNAGWITQENPPNLDTYCSQKCSK